MKKQPKLVLRESCVDDLSRAWKPGAFVEMGAGTGYMTERLLEHGYRGVAHDLSPENGNIMRKRLAAYGDRVKVVDDLVEVEPNSADYLFAFEVLEHIPNDQEALEHWLQYLRPGGRILVSVPAHQRKYGRSDELVGHVRRYEREQLNALLRDAGLTDVHIVNYGFPITELTRMLPNRIVRGDRSYDELTPVERSMRSAQVKPRQIHRILRLISGNVVLPFCAIQRWFYRFNLGDGLVATARKPD